MQIPKEKFRAGFQFKDNGNLVKVTEINFKSKTFCVNYVNMGGCGGPRLDFSMPNDQTVDLGPRATPA